MVLRQLFPTLIAVCLAFAGTDVAAKKRRGIALFPIAPANESAAGPAKDVDASLLEKATAAGLPVMTDSALRKRIRDPAGALKRCGEKTACLAKLGRKAKVAKILVGTATPTGKSVQLTIKVIDVKKGKVEGQATFEIVKKAQVAMMVSTHFNDLFGVADAPMDDALALPMLPDPAGPGLEAPGLDDPLALEAPSLNLEAPAEPGTEGAAGSVAAAPAGEAITDMDLALLEPETAGAGGDLGADNTSAEALALGDGTGDLGLPGEDLALGLGGIGGAGLDPSAAPMSTSPGGATEPTGAAGIDFTEPFDMAAFEDAPPPARESSRGFLFYTGLATGGVGVALAVVGFAFGAMRNGAAARAEEKDASGTFTLVQIEADQVAAEGTGHAKTANIMFAVGGSVAAIGGIMVGLDFIFADDEPEMSATVGPAQVGLRIDW